MKPLIITCAITGAETTKERQPALPITPKEQGIAAKEAVAAGASIIHLHVRDEKGAPSQNVDQFSESIQEIRAQAPGVIIQISTGGAVGESIENRSRPLTLKPEMASLNIGTMNFGDDVFYNHPRDVLGLAAAMQKYGICPELEIYDAGMLESAFRMAKQGVIRDPLHFQFVLGVQGGMSGDVSNLVHLLHLMEKNGYSPEKMHWGVAGIGRFQLPLAVTAMTMGGHVRVGFEDNVFYHKGVLAKSNAELVARMTRIAGELGRPVANIAQARELLQISD